MKFLDLLQLSIGNLARRKLRTALTVLGVLIGTASVVTMISLGIGINRLTLDMYEQYGSLTAISVSTGYDQYDEKNTSAQKNYIRDETITTFSKLEHVKSVTPILETTVILKQGIYETNISLIGANEAYLSQINLADGSKFQKSDTLKFIYGNMVITNFENTKIKDGYYWMTGILPEVDYMNKSMFVIFDADTYYSAKYGGEDAPKPPKKYLVDAAGVVEGDAESYNEYAYNVYCDIEQLMPMLKKVFKTKPIPGQPTTKNGKAFKYIVYSRAIVYADNINYVSTLQQTLTEMGYQTSSNMEWVEQSLQTSRMIQAMLGGIGGISLFVAAIGIANTMMMSIYERTKEIGIMKVLGCNMNRIRDMFLIESGIIGFLGGVTGLILSFIASFIVNHVGGLRELLVGGGLSGNISQIPIWLVLVAILFAIIVGMLAGLTPALRAMKLSPLSALRNE